MRIRVNRVARPVTVLGPGRRLGLWVQGCSIRCPGCASEDTWDPAAGRDLEVAALARSLADAVLAERLTGVTLTGGEPTEQGPALADLVTRMRAIVADGGAEPVDVLWFSGRTAAAAARLAPELWRAVDAAVCGPYRPDLPGSRPLRASANQTLEILTPLGGARFARARRPGDRAMQIHVENGTMTLIGLPAPGDLPRLEAALRRRGITMEGRSWQTR